MRFYKFINEALKPSEFRPLMKIPRDKNLYDNIFNGKDRVTIPFEGKITGEISKGQDYFDLLYDINDKLMDNGYELSTPDTDRFGTGKENYINGICYKNGSKNPQKIGKVLNKIAPELLQKFNNDTVRQNAKLTEKDLQIVISRHPYDIGGMSTGRGWTSCMNLKGGQNKHYVEKDVKEGSCVAYLVKKSDKNIEHPISRILLKPYFDKEEGPDGKVALFPAEKIYGADVSGFKEAIDDFLKEKQNLDSNTIFIKNPKTYDDDDSKVKFANSKNFKHFNVHNHKTGDFTGAMINSTFDGGTFKDGIFYDSYWMSGKWERGDWKSGNKIWSEKFKDTFFSDVDPNKFAKAEAEVEDKRDLAIRLATSPWSIARAYRMKAMKSDGDRSERGIFNYAIKMLTSFINTHKSHENIKSYNLAKQILKTHRNNQPGK